MVNEQFPWSVPFNWQDQRDCLTHHERKDDETRSWDGSAKRNPPDRGPSAVGCASLTHPTNDLTNKEICILYFLLLNDFVLRPEFGLEQEARKETKGQNQERQVEETRS